MESRLHHTMSEFLATGSRGLRWRVLFSVENKMRILSTSAGRLYVLLFLVCPVGGLLSPRPVHGQTPDVEATRLNNKAVELAEAGREQDALDLYSQALALNPHDDAILSNRAVARMNMRDEVNAIQDADELIRRHPLNVEYLSLRGMIYYTFNKDVKGREDYRRALELEPENLELVEEYLSQLHQGPDFYFQRMRYLALKGTPEAVEPEIVFPLGDSAEGRRRLQPQPDEIRLHGRVVNVDPETSLASVEVAGFGLPNGHFRALDKTKIKTVRLGPVEIVHDRWISLPTAYLRKDDFLVLIGRDLGQEFVPRRVYLIADQYPGSPGIDERLYGAKSPEVDQVYPGESLEGIDEATLVASDGKDYCPLTFIGRDDKGPVLFASRASLPHSVGRSSEGPESSRQDPLLLNYARKVGATIEWGQYNHAIQLKVESRYVGVGHAADHEILALRLAAAPHSFPLAKDLPARGEVVWVVGDNGGTVGGVAATVLWADDQRLIVAGTNGDEDGRQSGSVILNKNGEAIGQVIGIEDDVAVAAPVAALRRILATPPVR